MNEPRGFAARLVQTAWSAALAVFAAAGVVALRGALWSQTLPINTIVETGVAVGGSIGLIGGGLYLIFGRALRRLGFDGFGVQFGACIGACLYGLTHMIAPLIPGSTPDPGLRLLQGGFDGLLIGAVLGLSAGFLSGRALVLDRFGLGRFTLLYMVSASALWLALWLANYRALALPIALVLIVALKVVVLLLDYWADQHGDA